MSPEMTNWVLALLGSLVLLLISWIAWLTRRLGELEVNVAQNYVHKTSLDIFDSKTTTVLNHMASQIDEILKALYELKGKTAN